MESIRIRAGIRAAAGIAALALPLAVAGNAVATPRGDNGDVKIHNIATGVDEQANNPHVCQFYLDAFNFDPTQQVHWEIDAWAGTDGDSAKGAPAAQGDFTLKADGSGQTAPIALPDGHYKLFWTFAGENGAAKHKVFWVDCQTPAGGTGGASGGSTSTPSTSPSHTKGGGTGGSTGGTGGTGSTGGTTGGSTSSPNPTPTPSATTPQASAPTPSTPAAGAPSTTPTGGLAHTGADGSALIYALIGAAALGGTGYGLRRYASARAKG